MTKGLVALVAVAAMTGCASPEKKAEKAEMTSVKADAAYCNDLAGLASSIAAYTTLDSTSSVADLKKATREHGSLVRQGAGRHGGDGQG